MDEIFKRLTPQNADNAVEESDVLDDEESDEEDDGLEIVGAPSDAQFFNEQFRRGLRRRSSQQDPFQLEPEHEFDISLPLQSAFPGQLTMPTFTNDVDMDDPFIAH